MERDLVSRKSTSVRIGDDSCYLLESRLFLDWRARKFWPFLYFFVACLYTHMTGSPNFLPKSIVFYTFGIYRSRYPPKICILYLVNMGPSIKFDWATRIRTLAVQRMWSTKIYTTPKLPLITCPVSMLVVDIWWYYIINQPRYKNERNYMKKKRNCNYYGKK